MCCSALQCVAVCCNLLQCVAVCCRVLHCGVDRMLILLNSDDVWICIDICACVCVCASLISMGKFCSICDALQHDATRCNTLQHTATAAVDWMCVCVYMSNI